MRHDAQFDLGIIGSQQPEPGSGTKPPVFVDRPQSVPGCSAGSDQWKKASGRNSGLMIRGVHTARIGVNEQWQFLGVGRTQFAERAVFQDQFW
ncbi:MAG: hypothetical protein Ct9H300mP14_03190 [Gammaproteobacteria bacterium]|nr:MAG: hypothetical protein Ct9H300mP14_03190 [Gammaproteobacteria bacterium]